MANLKKIVSFLGNPVRLIRGRLRGGIACRISFFMSAAIVFVAVLVGTFFFWQVKKALDEEIRGRALYVAGDLSASLIDDIITGNKHEIYKKLILPFTANEDSFFGSDLLYIRVYDHRGRLLIGSSATGVFFNNESSFSSLPSGKPAIQGDAALPAEARNLQKPLFLQKKPDIYDLTFPVRTGKERVGFVRVGISGRRYSERFADIRKKAGIAVLGILVVGMAFSQLIALGITKPILQLSAAVEKLSRRNWDSPVPVKGRDEISNLGHAFNQMALTLKQRELSLSRGNKDLFILHTAGLDLMETLELDALLTKVTARAEDLVRADTVSVAIFDANDPALKYIGVYGSKARLLKEMKMPLEAGGIYNWLACYGTPLLIADAENDFRLDTDLVKSLGITSMMSVPLWSSNIMKGVLTAVNKKSGSRFDKHDLRLFTVLSNLAAAALQNASLYADLAGKIKELRSAQEQLIHSTKMAAIGELAANIAHEINNPLTSVLGYTTHLLKTLDLPEPSKRILIMMEQETLRVRKIIRNLLDFSRHKTGWMQPSDIILPLKETVAFVQGAARAASVTIHEDYKGSAMISMDTNEMKQVFINIINNALQAMPRGGDLHIRLFTSTDHEAVIEFTDTGVGILPENMKKIFEPFFSTKEDGDGTGLGLSISYRIVKNHGGRIEVESTGKGTLFRIFLPLSREHSLTQKQKA